MLDTQVDVEQPSVRKLLDMVFKHNSTTSRRVCALMLSTDDNRYAWRSRWFRNLDHGNRAAVFDFLSWVGDGGFLSEAQMTALQERWEICGWGKVDD